MPPATATAASEPPPLFLLPPLPGQPGVPLLRELCLDKVAAEPAASLACVARGKGWQREAASGGETVGRGPHVCLAPRSGGSRLRRGLRGGLSASCDYRKLEHQV